MSTEYATITYYDILIIDASAAGIATAIDLKMAGVTSYLSLEERDMFEMARAGIDW